MLSRTLAITLLLGALLCVPAAQAGLIPTGSERIASFRHGGGFTGSIHFDTIRYEIGFTTIRFYEPRDPYVFPLFTDAVVTTHDDGSAFVTTPDDAPHFADFVSALATGDHGYLYTRISMITPDQPDQWLMFVNPAAVDENDRRIPLDTAFDYGNYRITAIELVVNQVDIDTRPSAEGPLETAFFQRHRINVYGRPIPEPATAGLLGLGAFATGRRQT
ncbi:MAG: PEP-CTERM sorting domain-containing protein [Planctomycetota bacterium]